MTITGALRGNRPGHGVSCGTPGAAPAALGRGGQRDPSAEVGLVCAPAALHGEGRTSWRVGQALLRSGFRGVRRTDANLSRKSSAIGLEALGRFVRHHRSSSTARSTPRRRSRNVNRARVGVDRRRIRSAEYCFSFFGYPAISLKQPVDWHHDPLPRPLARLPSHRIDHRPRPATKWMELNRLQHLPCWFKPGYSPAMTD